MRTPLLFIVFVPLLLLGAGCTAQEQESTQVIGESIPNYTSPYIGEETRNIKSLADSDIESLEEGSGVAFGGMAKLAELNGYPGPRHLLDMVETEMNFTNEQLVAIETIYEDMKEEAIALGEQIIALEQELNNTFLDGTINQEVLEGKVSESAELYGQLRFVHLSTHLQMMDILTDEQVLLYNELRGYASGDPCNNVPEGHDKEIWKLHHGC